MSEESEDNQYTKEARAKFIESQAERESHTEVVDKDFIPNFFPTFRINRKLYPLPIILTVICAGFLAYLTYVVAGVDYIEGGYVSEDEFGAAGGLINGIIFVGMSVISAFIMIYFVKKKGIEVLKYIFGVSFGFISFVLTVFFGSIIIYLGFLNLERTYGVAEIITNGYLWSVNVFLPIGTAIFTFFILYYYFTSMSYFTKNFIVIYIGLLIGAMMGVVMPLYSTLAILIGISCWDIFAVKSKRGPIKEMIDIASAGSGEEQLTDAELKDKIDAGEMVYDTAKLEIGIGDLAFYSMLTSSAIILTGSLIVMILTAIAIIVGTGITISGLKRNKILPGLPISIFLGIGAMLSSWAVVIVLAA